MSEKPSEIIEEAYRGMEDVGDFVPVWTMAAILNDLHARLQAIEDKQIEK